MTNTSQNYTNTRNIVAFQDLGTADPTKLHNSNWVVSGTTAPNNNANNVYSSFSNVAPIRSFTTAGSYLDGLGYTSGNDYQRIENAKMLTEGQEYSLQPQLGYISLNQELQPNQALAVAIQFTYNGQVYQIGEFANEVSSDKV